MEVYSLHFPLTKLHSRRVPHSRFTNRQLLSFTAPPVYRDKSRLLHVAARVNSTNDNVSIAPSAEETTVRLLENQSIWEQIKEIAMFTGPATGLWLCGPLMSLIDTAFIGHGSSMELAALGPGTVLCDSLSYMFMFLSIATSNMVATSLAKQDKEGVQHQLSVLLFIGLACGFSMLLFTKFFSTTLLTAFTGDNFHIVPAANKYVQIRGLAWPAILIGWIAQSASLGMKDSWGPLKALAVATVINGCGDLVFCWVFNYGIAGAAWATMLSQLVAAFMMLNSLNAKGYKAYAVSVPSLGDLKSILTLAAPVFIMITSKVAFYSLIVYFATSLGTLTLAAHQVMVQAFFMCTVWGEPLSQTAQSFMPEFLHGSNRSLPRARMLLKSLVIIGITLGLTLGVCGTSVTGLFPHIFTPDPLVINEMQKVVVPFFASLVVTPCILSFEGTLLAGRDLRYLSFATSACFALGSLILVFVRSRGYGLVGCWFALVIFQWARFSLALQRLLSPKGILFEETKQINKLEAVS